MNKKFMLCGMLLASALCFTSCSDDDKPTEPSAIKFNTELVAKPGKSLLAAFEHTPDLNNINVKVSPEGWNVTIDAEKCVLEVVPTEAAYGTHEIMLSAVNDDNEEYTTIVPVTIAPMSDKMGTYVLSEGPFSPGRLLYIDGDGDVFDNAYFVKNNEKLGAIAQDMYFRDGKVYIICQDGMLIVADAATMVKINSFTLDLYNPTHVAVFDDENIYIRDSNNIYHFNSITKVLTAVENTEYPVKTPMLINGNKLYIVNGCLKMVNKGEKTIAIKSDFTYASGVSMSEDGNLYVSSSKAYWDEPTISYIRKVNPLTLDVIDAHEIADVNLEHDMEAASSIAVKGDTIYYSSVRAKVWRHIYSTNETKCLFDASMCDIAYPNGLTYNTVAVHPITGKLYMNRLSGYATYDENKILVMEDKGDKLEVINTFDNYTEFPAGIFFPANFK